MSTLVKVIIALPFTGNAQTFEHISGVVMYSGGKTLNEYLNENPTFKAVSWEEYFQLHHNYYFRPLREITYDEWDEMLNVLPPLKWHDIEQYNVFFNSEAYSGSLHSLYVRDHKTEKCFVARICVHTSDADILKMIKEKV